LTIRYVAESPYPSLGSLNNTQLAREAEEEGEASRGREEHPGYYGAKNHSCATLETCASRVKNLVLQCRQNIGPL
jgi:hypothetical protein